eukprot:654486-Pleurochrysis_carterae.AAC.1
MKENPKWTQRGSRSGIRFSRRQRQVRERSVCTSKIPLCLRVPMASGALRAERVGQKEELESLRSQVAALEQTAATSAKAARKAKLEDSRCLYQQSAATFLGAAAADSASCVRHSRFSRGGEEKKRATSSAALKKVGFYDKCQAESQTSCTASS